MRFPDDVPVLTDGHVTLRAHRPEDAEGTYEQCTDPVSQRWTTVPVPYSLSDAHGFVTQVVPRGWLEGRWAFAVEAPDDMGRPRFCGTVELRDEGNRRAEIAYGAHPWARGRGVVDRALRLLLEWGFHEQRLRTVIWWANRGNWASRRAAWRLGFSLDGTLERWLPQRGDLLDAWVGLLHVDDARQPRHEWLSVPALRADDVVLRPFREDDAPRVVEACGDERTQRWFWRLPDPYTLDDARAYVQGRFEQLALGEGIAWAVADPAGDVLLGSIGVHDLQPGREAELGFWAHPDARGRGLMRQACAAVVRHALTAHDDGGLGLARVYVEHADGNTASEHVIRSTGFTQVSRQRRALRVRDGSLVDAIGYDVLAEEYAGTGSG
jgi:RimJ/RimL family protein N-acetyltransferase